MDVQTRPGQVDARILSDKHWGIGIVNVLKENITRPSINTDDSTASEVSVDRQLYGKDIH